MSADLEALPARLRDRIKASASGCWIWQGSPATTGYGQIKWRGRNRLVHRLVREILIGVVPDGLVLDHLCRVQMCCNPAHLEPVTNRVNVVERGIGPSAVNAVKTHCPSGHGYSPENTRVRNGKRHCLICHRTNQANYLARKRGAAA